MQTKYVHLTLVLSLLLFSFRSVATDGTKKWDYFSGGAIFSSPVIGQNGTIYIGNWSSNRLIAVSDDGSLAWEYTMRSSILYSPAVGKDGTIYVGAGNDFAAINPDGTEKWTYEETFVDFTSPSVANDGTIYVGATDDNLYAINPDGSLKWKFDTAGDIYGSPAISDAGTIYFGSLDGKLYAINPNGTLKWSFTTSGPIVAPPAIGLDGTVYFNSTDKNLYAVKTGGTQKWKLPLPDSVAGSVAIAADGTLYMGSNDHNLYAINVNGTIKWSYSANDIITSSPAIASDGSIYFGSNDKKLYAVNADGTIKWSYLSSTGFSTPTIADDGTVYATTTSGRLYAINGTFGLMNSAWPKFAQNNQNTGTIVRNLTDPATNFNASQFESNVLVAHPELRETWLPYTFHTLSFSDDNSAKITESTIAGYTDVTMYDWHVSNGRLIATSEIYEDFLYFGTDSFVDIFGEDTTSEIQALLAQGTLTSTQLAVVQRTTLTFSLLETTGAKFKTSVKIDNRYELQLPPNIDFQSEVSGSDSELEVFDVFDIEESINYFSSSQMIGDWAVYLRYSLPNYPSIDNKISGIYAESLTFSEDTTATGELSGTVYNWSVNNGIVRLTNGNVRYEINGFFNRNNQYLAYTQLYVNDQLTDEYSDLISKFDSTRLSFIDELVTELPMVINADFSSFAKDNWVNDMRIFNRNCCFAHQFSESGDMLFGIGTDTYSDPEKPQFQFPNLASSYSIVDDEIIIRRNLNSETRYGLRTWVPISVDDFGRAYVLERSVRFDSNQGENDEQLGAGYLIKPRINIFSKVDLSTYQQEYANSEIPQTDYDQDGIPDEIDTDDDNDGLPDTFELSNGLNPRNALDAVLDNDLDGLSNLQEFVLGTDINLADTDGDGIADNVDTNPLVFDEVDERLYSGQVEILPDINGDEVYEIGVLELLTQDDTVVLQVLNGVDQQSLSTLVWNDGYEDTTLTLHVVDDLNGNGVAEVGLFGVRDSVNNEGKAQMFVRDLQTGGRVSVLNWPANWREVSARVLPDMTGDGLPEIGLQGRFKDGYRPQLVVKNGVTNAGAGTFGYPDLFDAPRFYAHSDVNDDGVAEIATFGRVSRNNKIQIKVASGVDAQDRLKAYNFPDKWSDVSWHRLDDSNGDGEDDWGLFGINKADGRPQLIVKDGTDPRGALRIHAWPSGLQDVVFLTVPDMNGDGVNEVAAAGVRSNNGRYQLQVQDGLDRNRVLSNHNLNLNLSDVGFHVLPDLNGDGMAEIGFLGRNALGEYELVIRHGDINLGELRTDNLGSDWAKMPSISSLGDTDNDGLMNLLIYGQDNSADRLRIDNY